MTESTDLYADSFTISLTPYGASISFHLSIPHPDPNNPLPSTKIATVRMSIEHTKTMAMIMRRQVLRFEEEMGVRYPVPSRVLAQIGVGLEDWQAFWGEKAG